MLLTIVQSCAPYILGTWAKQKRKTAALRVPVSA